MGSNNAIDVPFRQMFSKLPRAWTRPQAFTTQICMIFASIDKTRKSSERTGSSGARTGGKPTTLVILGMFIGQPVPANTFRSPWLVDSTAGMPFDHPLGTRLH
mmetsp:Transcript_16776/g.48177  ORF Transcript_16776/g.48177 Transcript_16776/m.48177 type:complete len:103 (-) Transcript_16776:327-635(-)